MHDENDNQKQPANAIVIPLDNRVLGEFISGLLGQSRFMERQFLDRRFEIDLNWLRNLDQIIEQRLSSQNQAKLVSFSARFYFANGKVIIIEDHNAFLSFHDMSNELSTGVDLRWNYLIKFPLAKLPEKQEIRFSAFTDQDAAQQKSEKRKETKSFTSTADEDSSLFIAIHFTDVTWGEDIYGHMVTYVIAKTEAISKFASVTRKTRSFLLLPTTAAMVAMITTFWSLYSSTSAGLAKLTEKFGDLEKPSVPTIDAKLDLLLGLALARRNIDIFPIVPFFRAALILGVLFGLYFLVRTVKASFININDYSDRYLVKYGRNYEFIRYGIGATLLVGILGGVFANKIYDVIKGWF